MFLYSHHLFCLCKSFWLYSFVCPTHFSCKYKFIWATYKVWIVADIIKVFPVNIINYSCQCITFLNLSFSTLHFFINNRGQISIYFWYDSIKEVFHCILLLNKMVNLFHDLYFGVVLINGNYGDSSIQMIFLSEGENWRTTLLERIFQLCF